MATDPGVRFSERLRELIAQVPRPEGGRWTTSGIWKALNDRGVKISMQYVGQLRRGEKRPSQNYLDAFANLFDVPVSYFVDEHPEAVRERLSELAGPDMRRLVVHARGLRAADVDVLIHMADHLRQKDGLPPAGTPDDRGADKTE